MPAETLVDTIVIAVAALVGLAVLAAALLRAWNGWLDLKRLELGRQPGVDLLPGAGRIELADLKERLRKLEAIAAGVDL
ncbi:hypothetical protein OLX02_01805 [Novosphingobium sp. KCTC 2891]|uniref:hypothetical protein n=1 Tax=Novosphingobium sp. KCTC 2891 TaxID=2989730 RepID=UPI002223BCC3|nr:hypothetical protein [Novosphingobium sp. KCTC 2891]MCW1381548.1 hypothetical protein [Novosphingobium sp. KCTC 2891]